MLTSTLLHALAVLPQGGIGTSAAPIVINEFSYDDSGTDDLEFVELYSRSGAALDISGWSVVGEDPFGNNFTQVFAPGTVLAAGDYLVLGNAAVPNVDIVRPGGFRENDNESITIYDASSAIVDTLIYEANKGLFNPSLAEGEGVWGNFTLIEPTPASWSRLRDGYDTDNNGHDFRLLPWSPGTSNNQPVVTSSAEFFDALTVGTDVPGWGASFVPPRVVDPMLVDSNNPSVIAASPQGGNAAVFWDPAGGGNHTMQLVDAFKDCRVETYAYFDATPLPATEFEMWSFGFGASGTFYNFPDPAGVYGFTANGDTGLVWTYVRDQVGGTLYLYDRNDGGLGGTALTPPVVVGSVPIVAGTNDGWQRLLIEIDGTSASARFGGNFGAPDGTLFTTSVAETDRALFVSYRESVAGTTGARPFTCDLLTYSYYPAASVSSFGSGCFGLTLAANGSPTLGNGSFALDVGGVPLGFAFVAFGTQAVNPGLPLGGIGMPGCSAYTNLNLGLGQTGPVVGGIGSFALPIPNDLGVAGTVLATQGVALSLSTPLNLIASNGVAFEVGL